MMAEAYSQGEGEKKDEALALFWYAAARQNHVGAQSALGAAYANGLGVTEEQTQAASWYLKAAEQGDVRAQEACALLCLRSWRAHRLQAGGLLGQQGRRAGERRGASPAGCG